MAWGVAQGFALHPAGWITPVETKLPLGGHLRPDERGCVCERARL
jgi:hypothetical protein